MAELFEIVDLPIRINSRGQWLHGDEPLHPRVQILFEKNVVPRVGGHYAVVLGHARQQLQVDDTAYFVRSIVEHGDTPGAGAGLRGVTLSLSDGHSEELQPQSLMQSPEHVLYCRIVRHGLSVPCRFSPHQYHSILLHAGVPTAEQDNEVVLIIDGETYTLSPYDRAVVPVL